MFPAARIGDLTATGDVISGPGAPTVLIGGKPAACIGDLVSGTLMTGSIVNGSATVMIGGRPAARVTGVVNGVNNQTGTPVASTLVVGAFNVLIGG